MLEDFLRRRALIARSSHSGWGTSQWKRPKCISTLTCASKKMLWQRLRRLTCGRGDFDLMTNYSPFLRASDNFSGTLAPYRFDAFSASATKASIILSGVSLKYKSWR
jgi:hypothetical protein